MTSNQIQARANKEIERSNREKESETKRSNQAKEKLTRDRNRQDWASQMTGHTINLAGTLLKPLSGGKSSSGNDPKWYNLDPQMVKDVASISYDTPLGYAKNPVDNSLNFIPSTAAYAPRENVYHVPGIMVMDYIPMLGNENTVQTAALNIYSYVRHANSGSRNYEYQDLIKYLYAVDSVYIAIAELKRIYSLLNTYRGDNKYYADAYISALIGTDSGSILNKMNLAALRYYINNLCQRVNALYVPNVMSMFERHTWMSSTIWKDHPIKKSQNYMFTCKYLYKYDENVDSTSFGSLVPIEYKSNDLEQMLSTITTVLDSLLKSEDIGIMSGDILKAYGASSMYTVPEIPEGFRIEESYSEEVLSQITSATILSVPVRESFLIYEDEHSHQLKQGFNTSVLPITSYNLSGNGYPLCVDTDYAIDSAASAQGHFLVDHTAGIISMYKDDISPDDNMVASRLIVFATPTTITEKGDNGKTLVAQSIKSNGTEIIALARIAIFQHTTTNPQALNITLYSIYDGRVLTSNELIRAISGTICTFDWAPLLRISQKTGSVSNTVVPVFANRDLANFALITADVIDRMHRVAVNSELGVPLLGMQVRRR